MLSRVYIPLSSEALIALARVAQRERREARQQAAFMLEAALRLYERREYLDSTKEGDDAQVSHARAVPTVSAPSHP